MSNRPTIAGIMVLVGLCGAFLAGMQSGSNDWFKLIYTLTFLGLIYAAIAARRRESPWHGVAVAGWAYFVIGFGPWIAGPRTVGPGEVNRNLVSSFLIEVCVESVGRFDPPRAKPGAVPILVLENRRANRNGVAHCALTCLFALGGGLVSRHMARSRSRENLSPDA
ncbi:hypothetical protein [Paludisphaera rhizosphaerae]|uniref:hypothetical protein n=1 Tax=Paludisphaera rhizosphaerae TaxID=2711216 RepID=UPI0013EDE244|nr:hypothetical protein [Paludisphaera rhizosphaerae]